MHNKRLKYFSTLSDREIIALLLDNNAEAVTMAQGATKTVNATLGNPTTTAVARRPTLRGLNQALSACIVAAAEATTQGTAVCRSAMTTVPTTRTASLACAYRSIIFLPET